MPCTHADPAAPRRERLEPEEPLHRVGRRRPHREGPGRGGARGRAAGRAGLLPDVVHTSVLRRAIQTANLALDAADRHWIPVRRRGGSTSGTTARCRARTRPQTLEKYGEEQFMLWRRSFDTPPPPIDDDAEFARSATRATPTSRGDAAAHRVPQGRHRADAAVLGGRRSCPTSRPARRCWSPPTATRCGRWSSTSTASATTTSPGSTSPPACRSSTGSDDDFMPTGPGEYLDPEAAAAAAAAVANQGR